MAVARLERHPVGDPQVARHGDEDERQDVEDDPRRLGPFLEDRDLGEAVGHQRDHHQGVEEIADPQRHPEAELQRQRQDRRLQREEDEGERRVDQRRDRRADVAEAGAARQQVDVHPRLGGVVGDRQAGEEQHRADEHDRHHGVVEAVRERDRAADRLQSQERDRADGGVGDPAHRPAPSPARGEAQREILQRLVGDPLVVGAALARDGARPAHRAVRRIQ